MGSGSSSKSKLAKDDTGAPTPDTHGSSSSSSPRNFSKGGLPSHGDGEPVRFQSRSALKAPDSPPSPGGREFGDRSSTGSKVQVRINSKEQTLLFDKSEDHIHKEHSQPREKRRHSLKATHGHGEGDLTSPENRKPSKLCPYVNADNAGGHHSPRPQHSPRPDGHHGHGHHLGHHAHHTQNAPGIDALDDPASAATKQMVDNDPLAPILEEIQANFPVEEFEMTLYAALPRFRPGEHITLQDFREKKTLNGTGGKCLDHDGRLHVWTVLMDDGRKIRVIPRSLMKAFADKEKAGKPVEGYVHYGGDIIQVVLDTEHVSVHRHIKEHVVRVKTPPKEGGHHALDVLETRQKSKKKARKKITREEEHEEVQEEVVKPFEIDDTVVMKDAGGKRLGVGIIRELGEMIVSKSGENHRMMKVEFGQRGGVYNLEDTELMHAGGATKRASQML